jgi:hypothetical protein
MSPNIVNMIFLVYIAVADVVAIAGVDVVGTGVAAACGTHCGH